MPLAVLPGMIPPTPGADPASRLFGYATPPDGAGPIGPDQVWPVPITATREEILHALNPLQHVPVVGTIYRAATGETIPTTLRVLGAGIVGGPLGMLGAGLFGLFEAFLGMKPDQSRPPAPIGMAATGSEAGITPVPPGELPPGAYTTLATVVPEWLGGGGDTMLAGGAQGRGGAAYASAEVEWRRSQFLERGIA